MFGTLMISEMHKSYDIIHGEYDVANSYRFSYRLVWKYLSIPKH